MNLITSGTHGNATDLHTETLDSPHFLGTIFTLWANSNTETHNSRTRNPAITRPLRDDRAELIMDGNQADDNDFVFINVPGRTTRYRYPCEDCNHVIVWDFC